MGNIITLYSSTIYIKDYLTNMTLIKTKIADANDITRHYIKSLMASKSKVTNTFL